MTKSALSPPSNRPKFKGNMIGRGRNVAAMLTAGDRFAGFRTRRAFVKTEVKRFKENGVALAHDFVRYMGRVGVTRDGGPGQLYSATEDGPDGSAFVERCSGDRHHFRLIIAPEDSAEYDELKPLIRRFMARMEEDLGTALEWVAADHADTLIPHAHVMLRGKDDTGENLVISPRYIYFGMRERLAGMVSLDLGPPDDLEPFRARRLEVDAERLTPIDQRLLADMDDDRIVKRRGGEMADHAIRTGRLIKLSSLGLATKLPGGRWRLADDLEPILQKLAERSEIDVVIERACKSAGLERAPSERLMHTPSTGGTLTGRVLAGGFVDAASERIFLIVDAVDGRAYYAEIGRGEPNEVLRAGAIVRVETQTRSGHGGNSAARVRTLSPIALEHLSIQTGATWLDEELSSPQAAPRDHGFGREVRSALLQRRAWLIAEGLATDEDGRFRCRSDMLAVLKHRGIEQASLQIEKETGLSFREVAPDCGISGVLRRRVDLASGTFAQIETSREFSLMPWRPSLHRAIGTPVSAFVRSDGEVSWTIGRGPAIGL